METNKNKKLKECEKLRELDNRLLELEGISREERKRQVEKEHSKECNVLFVTQILSFTILFGLAIMFLVLGGTIHDEFYSPRHYASGSFVSAILVILLYVYFYTQKKDKESDFRLREHEKELYEELCKENYELKEIIAKQEKELKTLNKKKKKIEVKNVHI